MKHGKDGDENFLLQLGKINTFKGKTYLTNIKINIF